MQQARRSAAHPPTRGLPHHVVTQIQSNALGTLEAIDPELAEAVMAHGCVTGDRINGLCDGVSGDW